MKAERIFSALLLVTSLFFLWLAWGYTAPIAYDPLGPRPYPVLILSLLAACCLFLAVRPKQEKIELNHTPHLITKLMLCLAAMLLYAIFFELLGFPLATALMAFAIGKLFGGKTLPCAVSGVAMGIGLFFLFNNLLDVVLPAGFGM